VKVTDYCISGLQGWGRKEQRRNRAKTEESPFFADVDNIVETCSSCLYLTN
jgi:hypothetical protein